MPLVTGEFAEEEEEEEEGGGVGGDEDIACLTNDM